MLKVAVFNVLKKNWLLVVAILTVWPSPIDTDTSVRRILDFQTVPG